ncbi:MAG: RES family NAD+ phosphorylase [Candidatus Dormibacteraeota bacterium]|nr:RES family NAD+ phosphorylase [Candidatus Dormibacteraeota bacterium]
MGRGDDPLRPPPRGAADLGDTKAGNRFDSLTGAFGVLYFGTNLEVCFGETLSRYRTDPKLAFIEDEWRERNFMPRGCQRRPKSDPPAADEN